MKINEIFQYRQPVQFACASFDEGLVNVWTDTKERIADGRACELEGFPFELPIKIYECGLKVRIFAFPKNRLCRRPIMLIELDDFHDGYLIENLRVEPKYRGQKLALKMYLLISKEFNVPLYSGWNQTLDSMKLWKQLITEFPDRVVGYDQRSKEDFTLNQTSRGPVIKGNQPIYVPGEGLRKTVLKNDILKGNRTRLLKLVPE